MRRLATIAEYDFGARLSNRDAAALGVCECDTMTGGLIAVVA